MLNNFLKPISFWLSVSSSISKKKKVFRTENSIPCHGFVFNSCSGSCAQRKRYKRIHRKPATQTRPGGVQVPQVLQHQARQSSSLQVPGSPSGYSGSIPAAQRSVFVLLACLTRLLSCSLVLYACPQRRSLWDWAASLGSHVTKSTKTLQSNSFVKPVTHYLQAKSALVWGLILLNIMSHPSITDKKLWSPPSVLDYYLE